MTSKPPNKAGRAMGRAVRKRITRFIGPFLKLQSDFPEQLSRYRKGILDAASFYDRQLSQETKENWTIPAG
jgi:hypothetical protein